MVRFLFIFSFPSIKSFHAAFEQFSGHCVTKLLKMSDPIVELSFILENEEPKVLKIYASESEDTSGKSDNVESWRHDHGDLLPPRTPQIGVDLLNSLHAAKRESDTYLTSVMARETSTSVQSTKGSKRPLDDEENK